MPSNFTTLAKAKSHKRRQVKQFATEEEQQQLIKALYACSSKPVVLSTFSGVSNKFHWTKQAPAHSKMPLPLNTLYDSSNLNLTVDDLYAKCKSICDRMTISCHEQSMIYDCTKAQSSSMTWFEQRIGRVSSSVVHRVLHTSIEKPSTSLLMQICNPSTAPINTPPILWGRQQEQVTLKEYSQIVSPEHQNFSITTTGFLIDQEHPFIGVSADSISTCECHGKRTRTSLQTQIVASMIATN